jgi:betaine-aldehyde dehydrogenase
MHHDVQPDVSTPAATQKGSAALNILPVHRDLYYGGAWHAPQMGKYFELFSPGTGESIGRAADGSVADVNAAVDSAYEAFPAWRDTAPMERAKCLRRFAAIVRENARELAMLDAIDCGNPVRAMVGDAEIAASQNSALTCHPCFSA